MAQAANEAWRSVAEHKAAFAKRTQALFHPAEAPPSELTPASATCSTIEINDFLADLRDSPLPISEQADVLSLQKTNFQHERTSADGHFLLKWDSTGPLAVSDAIVNDAEADLAAANVSYTSDFGQPPCPNIVDVLFDNARTPQTVLPAGPISLPAGYMNTYSTNALARKLTATHELFHVLQGGFGFRLKAYTKWFLEGGATWSEAAYCNAISGWLKLSGLFENPLQKLTKTIYTSLPFFIFLENIFNTTKNGRYFMVDWMKFDPNRPPDANPLVELNLLAPSQRDDFNSDRLLVQFALQMALKNWYMNPGGGEAIPQFRDALAPGDPQIPYADQTVILPPENTLGFTDVSDTGLMFTTPRLNSTQFYFMQVGASSAVAPYAVIGQFADGQRRNPYVGAAIMNPHTGQPAAGHSQIAEDTSLGLREFTFASDSELAYFVTAGSHTSFTNFTLFASPHGP